MKFSFFEKHFYHLKLITLIVFVGSNMTKNITHFFLKQ